MRAIALLLVAVACTPNPVASPVPYAAGEAASAPTPWQEVTEPSDPALTELPAHVVGDPAARSQIAVVYAARIVRVHVRIGDRVAAGDPVVEVAVPELLRAQAAIAAADARAAPQRRRAEQLRGLQREGLVGGREIFEIDATLAALDADRRAAAAVVAGWGSLESSGHRGTLLLRAPSAGVVVAVDATVGEVRDGTGGPLVEIRGEGLGRVELRAAGALPPGAAFRFVGIDGRSVPLSPVVDATAIDPSDGSTRVWMRPDPPVPLPEGLRGRVLIHGGLGGVVQVPERSMRWHDGGMVVVVRDGDVGRSVPVEVVGRSGSTALVRGAVTTDDEVAADATAWLGAEREQP